MSDQILYAFCRNCNENEEGFSTFTTFEGEIFHACIVCGSDEIIFHQDPDQSTDNGNNLANTVMEAIA